MAIKKTDKNTKKSVKKETPKKSELKKSAIKKTEDKKIQKKKKEEIISKRESIKRPTNENGYKKIIETLKLKLQISEKKEKDLNEQYEKSINIREKKLASKYKKIIKNLEEKKDTKKEDDYFKKTSTLKIKINKLEEEIKKLTQEKDIIFKKNEELEKNKYPLKTDKNMAKSLQEKLKESEREKKELKIKLNKYTENASKLKKETQISSKKELEIKKENIKLLKTIEKEAKTLEKKQEVIKKEEEKLRGIRNTIESSAKNIVSSINKNKYKSKEEAASYGDIIPKLESEEEKRIVRLASLLSTAIENQKEVKEKPGKETSKEKLSSNEEERLNKAADKLESLVENGLTEDSTDDKLKKRSFTIIEKIENSKVEINEGAPVQESQNIKVPDYKDYKKEEEKEEIKKNTAKKDSARPIINVTVESPKESAKLEKPETTLKPASETPTMRMKLLDDADDYEKRLVITYGFDNMPENTYYSKYKKILRNAARITLLGNLKEGLDMFKLVKEQNLPKEYKDMIEKNIQDITYYLRGLHRVRME